MNAENQEFTISWKYLLPSQFHALRDMVLQCCCRFFLYPFQQSWRGLVRVEWHDQDYLHLKCHVVCRGLATPDLEYTSGVRCFYMRGNNVI